MIDDLLSLAGEAVAHARKLGADAVHAVAADGRSTEIAVLDGKIEKVEHSEARDISLKVYAGRASATISGSVLTKEAIHRLAENALRMAQLAPPDPFAGIAEPEQLARDIPDLDLAAHDLPDPKRLEELGKPFLYYENIDGGHSAAANLEESARRVALEYTYLSRKLMD